MFYLNEMKACPGMEFIYLFTLLWYIHTMQHYSEPLMVNETCRKIGNFVIAPVSAEGLAHLHAQQ